jgi:hypothetical protein
VLVVLSVLAAACDAASGASDERLRATADRLSTSIIALQFPWTGTADAQPGELKLEKSGSLVPQSGGEGGSPTSDVRIGNTQNQGVSLRSDCADGARSGGSWADNVQVQVVEHGADRCSGWTRVKSGSTVSWVRNDYLVGLPPPSAPLAEGGEPPSPVALEFRGWVSRLLDGAGRVALLSRHPPGSKEAGLTSTFLERVSEDMRTLSRQVGEAPPGIAGCEQARVEISQAAGQLADLSLTVSRYIKGEADSSALTSATDRYIGAQEQLARSISACGG